MHNPPGEEWVFFGKHRHRFESPDIYFCRIDGDVSETEMETQISSLIALSQRAGRPLYWLCDVSKMGIISPEARRATARASSGEGQAALAGTAIFGAAFAKRVMVNLSLRAVRILNPTKIRPIAFVETETQARAFISAQRDAPAGRESRI